MSPQEKEHEAEAQRMLKEMARKRNKLAADGYLGADGDIKVMRADLLRMLRKLAAATDALKELDSLDWCIGYELGSEANHEKLDRAQTLAREILEVKE